jgi:hypothetical protein
MNFSVHLNDELLDELNKTARESGRTRNALIREAIGEWLGRRRSARWPELVLGFQGIPKSKRFEDYRSHLKPPREPFDAFSA